VVGGAAPSVRVARSPRGEVVAFTILCELSEIPQRLLTRDAVSGPWRRHLRSHPIPRDQRVLVVRLALAYATGSAASPCLAALLRDMERASLEAGPGAPPRLHLRDRDELLAQLAPLGFEPPAGRADLALDGRPCATGRARAESIAAGCPAWRRATCRPSARARRGRARAGGRRPADPALAAGVRRAADTCASARGRSVARDALLRDVWGYEWTGGSNVVDVAVSGLRRQLGPSAGALETVRGVGYRLQPLG
jgi:hypothetical protein